MFTWSFAALIAAVKSFFLSAGGMTIAFFTTLLTNAQSYFWMGLVLVSCFGGFQAGKWWYDSDCKRERKAAYNVGFDQGYNMGYDGAKAGKRKLAFPHLWAPGLTTSGQPVSPDLAAKWEAFGKHIEECPECSKMTPEGYPSPPCPEAEKMLDEIMNSEAQWVPRLNETTPEESGNLANLLKYVRECPVCNKVPYGSPPAFCQEAQNLMDLVAKEQVPTCN